MAELIINAAPLTRNLSIDTLALGKAAVDSKQAMSTGGVGPGLDAQVLKAGATMTPSGYTVEQLDDTIGKLEAVVEGARQALAEAAKSSLTFDPGNWEKHILVLVAAIAALNVARQSSAAMSGVFTQIAFKAAEAQGVATRASGEASMHASIAGAVVAGSMAVGGAGTQIRGHQLQHTDIKTNKVRASGLEQVAQDHTVKLKTTPPESLAVKSTNVSYANAAGELKTLEQKNHNGQLSPEERAVVEQEIRQNRVDAKELNMKSALAQGGINKMMVVGSAFSSIAQVLSAAVTSAVRVEEYIQRQKETLHQAEQNVNKSVSEAANQMVSEDSAMLVKQLETLLQIAESRNSTINTIANARA